MILAYRIFVLVCGYGQVSESATLVDVRPHVAPEAFGMVEINPKDLTCEIPGTRERYESDEYDKSMKYLLPTESVPSGELAEDIDHVLYSISPPYDIIKEVLSKIAYFMTSPTHRKEIGDDPLRFWIASRGDALVKSVVDAGTCGYDPRSRNPSRCQVVTTLVSSILLFLDPPHRRSVVSALRLDTFCRSRSRDLMQELSERLLINHVDSKLPENPFAYPEHQYRFILLTGAYAADWLVICPNLANLVSSDFRAHVFRHNLVRLRALDNTGAPDLDTELEGIRRSHIIADSVGEFLMDKDPKKIRQGPFAVSFEGEVSIGNGIITNWINTLGKELFDPRLGLFEFEGSGPRKYMRIAPGPIPIADADAFLRGESEAEDKESEGGESEAGSHSSLSSLRFPAPKMGQATDLAAESDDESWGDTEKPGQGHRTGRTHNTEESDTDSSSYESIYESSSGEGSSLSESRSSSSSSEESDESEEDESEAPRYTELDLYRVVGRFVGMVLSTGYRIPYDLSPMFYAKIMHKIVGYEILGEYEPEVYRSLKVVVDPAIKDPNELMIPIPRSAESIGVDEWPLELWKRLMIADYAATNYATYNIGERLAAFEEGLYFVVGREIFECGILTTDLRDVLFGSPDVDVDDLMENLVLSNDGTEYLGDVFTVSSPQIIWLGEVLKSWSQDERRAFVEFVTGSSSVPAGGFSRLAQPITISRYYIPDSITDNLLPKAHNCFNGLDLPPFSSKKILEARLKTSIAHGKKFDDT